MNSNMRSSVMGLLLGQFSSPLPMAQKEPVAYLYNGVQLPDINEVWTDEVKAEYPYAHIVYYTEQDIYTVRYHKSPISYTAYYESTGTPALIGSGSYFAYDAKGDGWELYQNKEDVLSITLNKSQLVWSSHDILNIDDNSVYLAASDPIPVYE